MMKHSCDAVSSYSKLKLFLC